MNQAIVSLTFDDGWKSHFTSAYPLLWKHGMEATFYIISERLDDEKYPMYMNWSDLRILRENGMEIGSHTRSHKHLPQLEVNDIWEEIEGGKKDLQRQGFWPTSFAYPFGEWTPDIVKLVREAGFFTARSIVEGLNWSNNDPLLLRCMHVVETTTSNEVYEWIDGMEGRECWTILMFHQIEPKEVLREKGMIYGTTPEILEEILVLLRKSKTHILTVEEGMERVLKVTKRQRQEKKKEKKA